MFSNRHHINLRIIKLRWGHQTLGVFYIHNDIFNYSTRFNTDIVASTSKSRNNHI